MVECRPVSATDPLLLKFIVVGDTGTGKSCLLHRFIEQRHKADMAHTVGVEFGSKFVTVSGRSVKLQVWDTAGQERFRSVTRSYYRGAVACLLVFDITSRESFEHAVNWLQEVKLLAQADVTTVLVGNKTDLCDARAVGLLEASRFAQEHGCSFLEASAATGDGVDECFLKAARTTLSKFDDGRIVLGEGVNVTRASASDAGRSLSWLRPPARCCA